MATNTLHNALCVTLFVVSILYQLYGLVFTLLFFLVSSHLIFYYFQLYGTE